MASSKKIVLQQLKDFQNQYECLIKLRKLKEGKHITNIIKLS